MGNVGKNYSLVVNFSIAVINERRIIMFALFYFGEFLIGAIFLLSFLSHFKNRMMFTREIKNYKIFLSKKLNEYIALLILFTELLFGLLLVSGVLKAFSLIGSLFLLFIFCIAVSINLIRGNTSINCGCGGILRNKTISWKLVIRNCMFILFLVIDYIFLNFFTHMYFSSILSVNVYVLYSVVIFTATLTLLVIYTNNYFYKIKSKLLEYK